MIDDSMLHQNSKSAGPQPKVLYLTWGEVPINSGLFDNQVFEQLKQIRQQEPALKLALLSGMPLLNQYIVKKRATFFTKLDAIQAQLHAHEIDFSTRWIGVVARWFHSQYYQLPLYIIGQQRFLYKYVTKQQVNLVHCRGYHATNLALRAKAKYGLDYKVIFDTRGMFPEESVFAQYFTAQSRSYQRWKQLEKWLLDHADAIVNVSGTFSDHVRTLTTNPQIYTIYTSTNLAIFQPDPERRQAVRAALGIAAAEKVLVYLGSIGVHDGWHRTANLIAQFQAFQQTFPHARLLVITRASHQALQAEFDQVASLRGNYRLVAGASPAQTTDYLQAGDYAALPYSTVHNEVERLIGYTMIASKTGEYLAMGLPLVVNRAIGAASQLADAHAIGCTYTAGAEQALIEPLRQLDQRYQQASARGITVAHETFSAARNAQRYLELYRALMAKAEQSI